ncbi:MAG: GNAT family N-acetyltransferase [Pseudomonadota bacterium]
MSLIIRAATLTDNQGMRDVLNPIIRAGGTTANEVEHSEAQMAEMIDSFAPPEFCNVAEEDGRILGWQCIYMHTKLPPEIGDISSFVAIEAKGKGVGKALIAETLQMARLNGFTAINATIRADNFGGLAFYTAMGFRDHSVTRAKPLKSGKKVDRISKRLTL